MKTQSGNSAEGDGLRSAVRRFPAHAQQIQQLLARDESFRGLCDDLAAAEQALATIDQLPEAVRAARRAEYQGLVEDLATEIEQALRRAKIIPLPHPPKH